MRIHNMIAASVICLGLAVMGTVGSRDVFAAAKTPADESVAAETAEETTEETAEETAEEEVWKPDVTFTTYRGRDTRDEYRSYSGADGKVYMFLPSDANLARVTLTCSGKMENSTIGTISSDGKILSGNFTDQPACITMEDGKSFILVCAQSTLPSLSLRLKDSSLDEIHKNDSGKITAVVESTILTDPMDPANNFTVKEHAEFRGRGNSSWAYYDKKGYQLRLENSRSVLGMPKARKWVLLANSSDSSLMRNKIIFDTARAVGAGYSPQSRYVDLWIDGDYRGLYQLAEKAEIGKQRLNLTSGHGILAEFDNAFYAQEENFTDINGNSWAIKDYQATDYKKDFKAFEKKVNELAEALNEHEPWEKITEMIDEDQFARFYLTAEFFLNEELPTTSFYWYWDGPEDELHVGPIWDFDTSMQDGDTADTYFVWVNGYFKRLLRYSEFDQMIDEYYNDFCREIFALSPTTMDLLNIQIAPSAEMNYLRFDVLNKEDVKGHMFLPTYKENIEIQKRWLEDRIRIFSVPDVCAEVVDYYMTANVSEDSSTLHLVLRTKKPLKSLQFYVETEAKKGEDRTKYEAVLDDEGKWVCDVDLIDFNQKGTYTIEAFVNGTTKNPDASSTVTLDTLPTVSYELDGVDYSPVFDPEYYAEKYQDAKTACGENPAKLFDHFVETGMKERRQGSEEFDVEFYMQDNPDLVTKYGTDYAAFYAHYCEFGKDEGRPGTKPE